MNILHKILVLPAQSVSALHNFLFIGPQIKSSTYQSFIHNEKKIDEAINQIEKEHERQRAQGAVTSA